MRVPWRGRFREPAAVAEAKAKYSDDIERFIALQWIFDKQWKALKVLPGFWDAWSACAQSLPRQCDCHVSGERSVRASRQGDCGVLKRAAA